MSLVSTIAKIGGLSKIGEQNTNESFLTTDFERVIEGRTYSGWRFKDTPMILINSCVFDQDKNFITLLDMPLGNNIITIPQGLGACYLRCSIDAINGTAERIPALYQGRTICPGVHTKTVIRWRARRQLLKAPKCLSERKPAMPTYLM